MKVHYFFLVLVATLTFATTACKDKEPIEEGAYAKGVFVVNEGPFGGTGTITWHNPETGETVQDIFGKANNGAALGQFAQSLAFHNGFAYIAVNGANKIYVVDPGTFEYIDTIGGLVLPRFMLPLDDRYLLVSQWGDGGLNGSVAKIDLLTRKIVATIPTGNGAEKMIRFDDNTVYVANSGGFGNDSTLSVINLTTNTATSIVVGGKNPGSLVKARNGSTDVVMTLCKGDFSDPAPTGWLGYEKNGFATNTYNDDLSITTDGTMYYPDGGNIMRLKGVGQTPEIFVSLQFAYGLAVSSDGSRIYCADAADFNSAGNVVIYDRSGQKISSFETGIIPGEIVLK